MEVDDTYKYYLYRLNASFGIRSGYKVKGQGHIYAYAKKQLKNRFKINGFIDVDVTYTYY